MSLISKLIAEQILAGDKDQAKALIREALGVLTHEQVLREEFKQMNEDFDVLSEEMQLLETHDEECDCEDKEDCECEENDDDVAYEDEEGDIVEETEELVEGKRIVKRVTSKGKVIRKVKCSPGMKAQDGRCVRIAGKEKLTRRKAQIKRKRTLKRQSGSKKRKAVMKRQRALRKRKSMGL